MLSDLEISNVCELLGGSEKVLVRAVTWRNVETRRETVQTALSREQVDTNVTYDLHTNWKHT